MMDSNRIVTGTLRRALAAQGTTYANLPNARSGRGATTAAAYRTCAPHCPEGGE